MAVAAAEPVVARPLLAVRDLHVHLGQSHVLQGVTFDVPDGGVTALLGRNGVGKTSTLRAILGLSDRHGSVLLGDEELTGMPTHRIVRHRIGYVPEDRDVFTGLIKPVLFGFIISTVGCYYGISTRGGTQGVGRSTTQAVVASSVLILIVDFFVTKLIFAIFGYR